MLQGYLESIQASLRLTYQYLILYDELDISKFDDWNIPIERF